MSFIVLLLYLYSSVDHLQRISTKILGHGKFLFAGLLLDQEDIFGGILCSLDNDKLHPCVLLTSPLNICGNSEFITMIVPNLGDPI